MQQGGGSHSHQYLMGGGGGGAEQSPQSSQMVVEEASPISSRPPASTGNYDDFMPASGGGFSEMDALATAAAGDDADRGGGGGGGGGNRWPRQETLALLRIRSEMDAAFRDATVKGPLWDDVSRKLAELGYKRSAKKCKEKFENVDKYYKRTKEGRAGRQDGKSYKFFSELEALHSITASQSPQPLMAGAAPPSTTGATNFSGIGYSSPMPISSIRPHLPSTSISPALFPTATTGAPAFAASPMGLDFLSNSSSSSSGTKDREEDNEGSDMEGDPTDVAGSSRKRKRVGGGGGGSRRRMMEFFERLMKQVMQKQEAMQQKFLEAIEKKEQDRLIREEAWRGQEMARLAREHEIMAQERAVSASRDASIMAFLQKITGQTIRLPSPPPMAVTTGPMAPLQPSAPMPQPIHVPMPPQQPPPSSQQQKPQQQLDNPPLQVHPVNVEAARHYQRAVSRGFVLAAVPEQQVRAQESVGGGGSGEPPSSRWPKTEVLALIKLRSGLESRYQEAGPKGPLWEEISAGMQCMGYRRSAKRCKEKWENINKYFKKVKESSKKRPEDSKTCPYFHELDALYQKKIIGGSSSGGIGGGEGAGSSAQQVQHRIDVPTSGRELQPGSLTVELQAKDGDSSGHGAGTIEEGNGGPKKPEDTVKELIGRESHHHRLLDQQQQHLTSSSDKANKNAFELRLSQIEDEEDIMERDEHDDDDREGEEEEDEEELQEERKMAYKIEYQQGSRQNETGPQNGGGNGAAPATTSFMAMVQ